MMNMHVPCIISVADTMFTASATVSYVRSAGDIVVATVLGRFQIDICY